MLKSEKSEGKWRYSKATKKKSAEICCCKSRVLPNKNKKQSKIWKRNFVFMIFVT
jgi:hypothetical protein